MVLLLLLLYLLLVPHSLIILANIIPSPNQSWEFIIFFEKIKFWNNYTAGPTMTKLNGYFNPKKHVTSSEKTTAQFASMAEETIASTNHH